MRRLVTIRKISEILPIPEADLIERARIDGWNVVVKKGEFRAGDLCVYGEIDSVFPAADERFAFLEGKRLRTKKMRGVVSQGIAFPVAILGGHDFRPGDDVTALLGVTKYEPPPPKSMEAIGDFPWMIPKTDAERVQNLVGELDERRGQTACVTEKLDGSSVTVFSRLTETGWHTGVCSRNFELRLDVDNAFVATVKRLGLRERLRDFCHLAGREIALQGELVGPGVQGNKYKLPANEIRFFNAFDVAAQRAFAPAEFLDLTRELGVECVPVIDTGFVLHGEIDRYLTEAEGKSALNGQADREGVVYRTADGAFSFKAISNRFLLKND